MNLNTIFPLILGYEDRGEQFRLYVEGPNPRPSFTRRLGVRSPFFYLFGVDDAEAIRFWLTRNKAWQCMRVPVYSREKGVMAVLLAGDWNTGDGSALFDLARHRVIRDEDHRRRLQAEVRWVVESIIENPIRPDDLPRLQQLEDVVNAGPVEVELATTAEVVRAYFGG